MSFDWDNWIENELPFDARLPQSSMTDDDLKLKAVWDCAFPEGLKHQEWLQLIYIMHVLEGDETLMSFRSIAHHVGVLLNVNYMYLLNEVYGADSIKPDEKIIAYLKQRMQECGYYEWLREGNEVFHIEANSLGDLEALLSGKRPCKRLTLNRQPIAKFIQTNERATINAFVRATLSLQDWAGIEWRELKTLILWEEMMRVLQHNADGSRQFMSQKEAHAFVGAITKLLNDHERTTRNFTNHRANGLWYAVTPSKWEYWMVTMNESDIGIFGVEEE